MRQPNDRKQPFASTYSLTKTAGTGLIICGIITFIAMFYLLRSAEKNVTDQLSYYLPWCLAYGVPCLGVAGTGIYWITHEIKKPYSAFVFSIVCIVLGALMLGACVPFIAIWGNIEFFISCLVIAASEIVIASLAISCYVKGS